MAEDGWGALTEILEGDESKDVGFSPEVSKIFENLNSLPIEAAEENQEVVEEGIFVEKTEDVSFCEWQMQEASQPLPTEAELLVTEPVSSEPMSSEELEADLLQIVSGPTSSIPQTSSWSSRASCEHDSTGDDNSSSEDEKYKGLSAVEVARRKAQDMAMDSIGGKKRKSHVEDEKPIKKSKSDPNETPEKLHQRRYQRRLQKNRDTAYISRIRRRAYTTLLEESLTKTEVEKKELSGAVSSLRSELDSLKAELRKMNAKKDANPFEDSNLILQPVSVDEQSELSEHSSEPDQNVMADFFGMLKPIATPEPLNAQNVFQVVPPSGPRSHGNRPKHGRGGMMLMVSMFFILTIPGLYYSPTVSEIVTITSAPNSASIVPVTEQSVVTVWGDNAVVDGVPGGGIYKHVAPLPLKEKCAQVEHEDSLECLTYDISIENVNTGSFRSGLVAH